MNKRYYSLGLMSGTSGDGVDASIIQSDGDTKYKVILDKYFKYSKDIYEYIHELKGRINNSKSLKYFSKEVKEFEKDFLAYLNAKHRDTLDALKAGKFDDNITDVLAKVAKEISAKY